MFVASEDIADKREGAENNPKSVTGQNVTFQNKYLKVQDKFQNGLFSSYQLPIVAL